ncbi:MAG: sulfite exporter TauE/SafE family protein [Armatimonadaceae bacterium]
MTVIDSIIILALGCAVGVTAGMFSVGGGILITPILVNAIGLPAPVAVGTGLCQMIGVAVASLIKAQRSGLGELKLAGVIALPTWFGVQLGVALLQSLSEKGLASSFVNVAFIVMLAISALLMATAPSSPGDAPGILSTMSFGPVLRLQTTQRVVPYFVLIPAAIVIGTLGGILGIGGGLLWTPLLTRGVGMRVNAAAMASIGVLMITSLTGTVNYAIAGNVRLDIAMLMLVGASIFAQLGIQIGKAIRPQTLKWLFVAMVISMDVYLIVKTILDAGHLPR